MGMELGLYTFGDVGRDPRTGYEIAPGQRLRDLIEEVALADEAELDVFGVGEHHRADYAVSSPAIVLAAAAARTRRIRLTSAVTVLSSDDPVRVFQDFATLDLISGGRAEITVGRGSFTESFPLFGHKLDDYDRLFTEKLDLLLAARAGEHVVWSGRHRAPLTGEGVYPRPARLLPTWIAVGGTPQSAVRAGTLGLPLALAIIGGEPERFAPLVALYREAGRRAGHDPASLKVSINSHGFVADTAEAAGDSYFPPYEAVMSGLGRERGWLPTSRAQFDAMRRLRGSLVLGSPAEIVDKILFQHEIFGHDRFMLQMALGPLPHASLMRAIERYGAEVAPAVRSALAASAGHGASVTGSASAAT
jgi:probable LLM family oxidoreductase